jgi:hypothetical protein
MGIFFYNKNEMFLDDSRCTGTAIAGRLTILFLLILKKLKFIIIDSFI